MAMNPAVLLWFLVTVTAYTDEKWSTCRNDHVQSKYCDADFVIKATVKASNFTNPNWRMLIINIKSQIKINKEFMKLSDDVLKTIFTPISNDFSWKFGQKYVLSGHIEKVNNMDSLVVQPCDWVQLWSELGHRHKSSLRKSKFDRGCNCQIKMNNEQSKSDHECRPELKETELISLSSFQRLQMNVCFNDHGHCVTKSNTPVEYKCVWSWNRELENCLTNIMGQVSKRNF